MVGTDFIYNDQSLSDFNMIIADTEDAQEWVRRDWIHSDITSVRPIPNHYSVKYSDTLILKFFLIRCDDKDNEMVLNREEINELRSWLESPKTPTLLQMIDEDDYTDINYFGLFTDVQPFVFSGQCYGLQLTFTCNAPYGFSDINEQTYNITGGTSTLGKYLSESADKNEYVYPVIKIHAKNSTFGNNSRITIQNLSDNENEMALLCPSTASVLTIDCQKKLIYDNNNNYVCLSSLVPENSVGVLSAPNYSFYWLRLLPSINDLKFTVNNSSISKVTIESRDIIKAGGF